MTGAEIGIPDRIRHGPSVVASNGRPTETSQRVARVSGTVVGEAADLDVS